MLYTHFKSLSFKIKSSSSKNQIEVEKLYIAAELHGITQIYYVIDNHGFSAINIQKRNLKLSALLNYTLK